MNAKKLLALLLAMVLCLGVLAGCNPTVDPTEPSGNNNASNGSNGGEVTASVINAEKYPIDFDGTLTAITGKVNANTAHNALLMEELTGVDVEWIHTAQEQTPLLFTTDLDNLPDMFIFSSGLTSAQIKEYGRSGIILDFMELLDKMPNLKALYEADPSLFNAVLDEDGAAYFLPAFVNTLTMDVNLFYLRTDMAAQAGWDRLPTSIEEFLELCEDIKNEFADVKGFIPMLTGGSGAVSYSGSYAAFFFPAFGELMSPTMNVTPDGESIAVGFATEQYKRYITFMHTLYKEGYLDSECFSADATVAKAMMMDGKAAMHPAATFMTSQNFESGEMDITLMNPLTSQYQSEARWLGLSPIGGRHVFITKNCEDVDAACAFLDAFYAPRENPLNEDGTAWGISSWVGEYGEDFILDEEEGSYRILPHDGYDTTVSWWTDAGFGDPLYADWPYYEASDSVLQIKAIDTRDVLRPAAVYVTPMNWLQLTEDEQDIYNDAWTDVNKYVIEMNAAFITGQKDIEAEWNTYVKTLEDYGLQDAIDVYQDALDRFNSK